jgi:hypothetical protein
LIPINSIKVDVDCLEDQLKRLSKRLKRKRILTISTICQ